MGDPWGSNKRVAWILGLVLALAGALAWSNSFDGPFVFDDTPNILENTSIRHFPPAWPSPLDPITGVSSRPVAAFTLAANRAADGYTVWGYHAVNLAIHLCAALALFGLVRRTLLWEKTLPTYGAASLPLAFLSALLWMLHPLQTASVTYIIQRCESLMGMFFLGSLYLAVRGWQSTRPWPWHVGAVVLGLLGAGSKEVIAVLPAVALAYDWVFVQRGVDRALKASRLLYAGYGLCSAMVFLLAGTGGTVGTPLFRTTALQYLWTQPEIILHYLRLSLWPSGQSLDYLWPAADLASGLVPALVVVALVALSARSLLRGSPLGFLGAWFFVILAPSSSVVPLADLAFEHRMYLPLAAISVLVVTGGYVLLKRLLPVEIRSRALAAGVCLAVAVAAVLGLLTRERNRDFRSEVSIWEDTANKRPENPRARNNLGAALEGAGRHAESLEAYREAIELKGDYADAYMNLGAALAEAGDLDQGLQHLERARDLEPNNSKILNNLGSVLDGMGRTAEAVEVYREAVRQSPWFAMAHLNLGTALVEAGDLGEGLQILEEARDLEPGNPRILNNLGSVLHLTGRNAEAVALFRQALRQDPGSARAHTNLTLVLAKSGQVDAALEHCGRALELDPGLAGAHLNCGVAHSRAGDAVRAMEAFRRAVDLDGESGMAHQYLGLLHGREGNLEEAAYHTLRAVDLGGDSPELHSRLGYLYLVKNDHARAAYHYDRAVELDPGQASSWINLGLARAAMGEFDKARRAQDRALAISPGSVTAHYNMACLEARVGRPAQAVEWLEKSTALGFSDLETVRADPVLASLRDFPAFRLWLQRLEAKGRTPDED